LEISLLGVQYFIISKSFKGEKKSCVGNNIESGGTKKTGIFGAVPAGKAMETEIEADAEITCEPATPGGGEGGGGGEAGGSGSSPGGVAVAESDGADMAQIETRRRYADAIVEACRQRMLLQVDLLNQKYR
jgi:hypothetical protein